MLTDFRYFERVNCSRKIKIKHFKEKRTFLNIFEWIDAPELLITMAKVCKKFYILSWSEELISKTCQRTFGLE